jgi:hypothetical protein
VFSYASYTTDIGLQYVKSTGAEMQRGHDYPEGFGAKRMGCKIGLGVDSSVIYNGDMFYTMSTNSTRKIYCGTSYPW